MQNKNDKIVELIKAVLNRKVVQYSLDKITWEDSALQKSGELFGVVSYIVEYSDTYRIKPETKKITVRSWLSWSDTPHLAVLNQDGVTEGTVETSLGFKQWLDAEPRVYEVEI
jgi:hypothetical protein